MAKNGVLSDRGVLNTVYVPSEVDVGLREMAKESNIPISRVILNAVQTASDQRKQQTVNK